jgi:hypothetical protein
MQPIMDDLKGRLNTPPAVPDEASPPQGPLHPPQPNAPQAAPPKPAELDQDPGGGYNANRTYPQT